MKYDDMIKLKRYCQSIIEKPRAMAKQNAVYGDDGRLLYCDDWHLIELLKCMFHGGDVYLDDPPPRRLRDNPQFDIHAVVEEAMNIMTDHNQDVDDVIQYLKERRGA